MIASPCAPMTCVEMTVSDSTVLSCTQAGGRFRGVRETFRRREYAVETELIYMLYSARRCVGEGYASRNPK